jgi:hypothetical protein
MLTTGEGPTVMVESAKHHFYRDLLKRGVEALRHVLTDIEED